jgi:hypothetical protein
MKWCPRRSRPEAAHRRSTAPASAADNANPCLRLGLRALPHARPKRSSPLSRGGGGRKTTRPPAPAESGNFPPFSTAGRAGGGRHRPGSSGRLPTAHPVVEPAIAPIAPPPRREEPSGGRKRSGPLPPPSSQVETTTRARRAKRPAPPHPGPASLIDSQTTEIMSVAEETLRTHVTPGLHSPFRWTPGFWDKVNPRPV